MLVEVQNRQPTPLGAYIVRVFSWLAEKTGCSSADNEEEGEEKEERKVEENGLEGFGITQQV